MYENLLPRFLRYVKTETRSDATSQTTPSTQTQVAFARIPSKLVAFRYAISHTVVLASPSLRQIRE